MIYKLNLFSLLSILFAASLLSAEESRNSRLIRVEGRKAITVSQDKVSLGDLAEISSPDSKDDETVIALKKIEIVPSPVHGQETLLEAARVLEQIKAKGVNLSDITYVLPRMITISRASRVIALAEVDNAVREAIKQTNREINIKSINYSGSMHISPKVESIRAVPFVTGKSGQMGFTIHAESNNEVVQKFDVIAQVDEWAEMPVAGRTLARGSKINPADVVMARLNITNMPGDSALSMDEIVGQEVNTEIVYGETFRRAKLTTPPVINSGSKVIMVYRSGALEASATGTALEAGALGQEIRVRNENSKKIVSGRVLEAGTVEVRR